MIIQINTDKNISGNEKLESYLNSLIEQEFSRLSNQITRIEVHLSDQNGGKEGIKDKRCMLEARLEGMQPIAVTADEATIEKVVNDAIDKLKTSLDTKLGRLNNH